MPRPLHPSPSESAARGRVRAPAPIRLAPNLYIAHTQPGLEGVAWQDIAQRTPAAVEIARRAVADRAGMTIFGAPRPDALARLRTAEDLFMLVGYRRGLPDDESALEKIRTAVAGAPYVAQAVNARSRLLAGSRTGRRLHFRVIARLAGQRPFRRLDFQRAVERAILERGDHAWRLVEDRAEVEFWATLLGDEMLLAVRLSDERMRHRDYKAAHLPGSLRPSAAASLALLSEPVDDDVFLDPMCGAGTVLIERAHLGRYKILLGGDLDPQALSAARTNIGPSYKPIELGPWDAAALPMADSSVSKIVTNMPWGLRHGSHPDNRRLYPRLLAEFTRVLMPGGKMVLLTAETSLMGELIGRGAIRPLKILHVTILGARAAIYIARR